MAGHLRPGRRGPLGQIHHQTTSNIRPSSKDTRRPSPRSPREWSMPCCPGGKPEVKRHQGPITNGIKVVPSYLLKARLRSNITNWKQALIDTPDTTRPNPSF